MRKFFNNSIRNILFCIVALTFAGCLGSENGSSGNSPPTSGIIQPGMDAEIVQGRNERAFYAARSQSSGSVILLNAENHGLRGSTNLYCQLNPIAKGVLEELVLNQRNGAEYSVSQFGNKALSLAQGLGSEVSWGNFGSPFVLSGTYLDGPWVGLNIGQNSQFLVISDFRFAIPETAKITKITATLTRRGNCYTLGGQVPGNTETGLHLFNVRTKEKLTPNAGRGVRVLGYAGTYQSETYILASSPTEGPGVLTPSLVNSPDFGFTVSYLNESNCEGGTTRMAAISLKISYVDSQ